MNFGSDNQAGVSAPILDAITEACASGVASSYGNDVWCQRAEQQLADWFGQPVRAFFLTTGTAANCLALSALAQPWQAVICHAQAHLATDESSAPEFFTGGARLLPVQTASGKLLAKDLERTLAQLPSAPPHTLSAAAVSITQSAENGLVYSIDEVSALSALAHQHGLHLHMDGARLANAIAALGCSPARITAQAGVDVLSLGASKSGALNAEAVVFFNLELARHFEHRVKRAGHMASKSRLLGAQFCAWLQNDHGVAMAAHANAVAQQLAQVLQAHPSIRLAWPVQASQVFAVMPTALLAQLNEAGVQCYDWYPSSLPPGFELHEGELPVRFVASWASDAAEVQAVATLLQR